jgi:ABC-type Fe3+/spermidine/putrescine transport system ATPase subunit
MTEVILENLTRQFPRQPEPTIHHISLTVQRGELLALLGPSGSGKSTILKLIAGIDQPDDGNIRFNGESILSIPANRRGAALMFQKAYLFPFLTIADNIGFGLKVKKVPKATIRSEVARMLAIIELPGMEKRYPAQLSGGEQQRVALARSLVIQPRVLMLDEPLSSLDTAVRQTLQEVIRRVQREMGITTIMVTHDLSEAIAMSDRTALLLNGTIATCDTPSRLFQRPPTRSTARFVGVSTFLYGQVMGNQLVMGSGTLTIAADSRLSLPVSSPVSSASAAPPSSSALFAIRPEHMRLLDTPADNTLPATITDVLYKGEYTEYQVALPGQTSRIRAYHTTPSYAPGAHVSVQFPMEHLFEVKDE